MANGPYYAQGEYRATIVSHTFVPGKFGVQLVLGIEPIVDAECYERTIYLPLLDLDGNPDKGSERTVSALNAIGYADAPSRLDKASDNPASLVGTEIDVVCKYNKEGRERWYIKTDREQSEPVDKNTLRKLDALFGKELKKGKPTTAPEHPPVVPPAPASAPQAAQPKSIEDANAELAEEAATDDIPF